MWYGRATVRRRRLRTINGNCLALADADEHSKVNGWTYQVVAQDEDSYEMGAYEVFRCKIEDLRSRDLLSDSFNGCLDWLQV